MGIVVSFHRKDYMCKLILYYKYVLGGVKRHEQKACHGYNADSSCTISFNWCGDSR